MKNLIVIILISFFTSCSVLFDATDKSPSEKRIALVIGNGNYPSDKLACPENDAGAMEEALERLDFKVYKYENLNKSQMERAIHKFGKKLEKYDVCLFYYSGNGYSSNGSSVLVPIDATLPGSEDDILHQCIRVSFILEAMEKANLDVNIIMLEANRNNPFEKPWTRGERGDNGSGLRFMNAPTGIVISYATSPGRKVMDIEDNHGLYTSALLECIETPDISILQMFHKVRKIVRGMSNGMQIPWESTSLARDFYLKKSE